MPVKTKIRPFRGLKIVQTIEDLKNVDCQFDAGIENTGPYLECKDCSSTTIVYNVLIDAEMSVDITNSIVGMQNESVQVLGALRCNLCGGTNIERIGYNPLPAKKEENKRLVPRYSN
jgi:hypothetical protein